MASVDTQLSDKFLVESTETVDNFDKVSTEKNVVYAIDQNNNSYNNGIVVIDTTNQLGGNSGMCGISEGYVCGTYPVSLKNGAGTLQAVPNAMGVFLKNGNWSLLDRCDISLNGKQIVAGQTFTGLWNAQRNLMNYSASQQGEFGTNILYPDNVFPTWSSSASSSGDSWCNNNINPASTLNTATTAPPYTFNDGAFKRAFEGCSTVNSAGTGINTFGWPTQKIATSQTNYTQNAKTYFVSGGTAANQISTWYFNFKIKLTDIHPIFETLDLVANPQIRLTLYFNVGSVQITSTSTATPGTTEPTFRLASAPTITGGSVCPVMMASGSSGNPNFNLCSSTASTAQTLTLAWGVVNNSLVSSGSNAPFATTRLYMPFYQLIPSIQKRLLENPIKKKVFNDVYIQQFINAASTNGASFTLTVQSTLPNIQYIALLPFTSQQMTSNFAAGTGINQFASPFDSAGGGTTQYGSGLYNLQVQVGAQGLYKNLISYDWQSFIDEYSKISAINGNDTPAIGNGLIDQIKWTNGYKAWLFDCSRVSSDIRQNVNIQAQLQNDNATDYYVCIVYRRSFDVNVITCEVTNLVN